MVMFERSAPWQHGYVKVQDVNVVNPLGGPVAKVRLGFTEEVVLLRHRAQAARKMQLSASDSYFVLRFDGTCATLAADEFSRSRIYPTRHAPVAWRQIDGNIRQVLAQNRRVDRARRAQTAECHGLLLGVASAECQQATKRLTRAIMAELNRGVDLPAPRKLPAWSP
jgi:hypothetical protein